MPIEIEIHQIIIIEQINTIIWRKEAGTTNCIMKIYLSMY